MALNNRNKLDEYHLKILRELQTHPTNKYCFDCHQRGPTYVNVTIGSFVCTTCSGMLRGLTPPHRVKSITMATFTPEEIEIMKSRGNQYCRNVWLGLYDSELPTSDEQQIKDFMIAKYEKKRYYVDPATVSAHCPISFANGSRTPSSLSSTSSSSHNSPSSQHVASDSSSSSKMKQPQVQQQQQSNSMLRSPSASKTSYATSNGNSQLFASSNFECAVPSSSSPSSSTTTTSSSLVDPFGSSGMDSSSSSEISFGFANFDNNPVFDATKLAPARTTVALGTTTNFLNAIYHNNNNNNNNAYAGFGLTLGFPGGSSSLSSYHRPSLKTLPLTFSRWSIATENPTNFGASNKIESSVPSEDKYAALKDLDCQMKCQMMEKQQEEMKQKLGTTPSSNGVNWSTLFSSSNPGVSSEPTTPFNPFSAGEINAWTPSTNGSANPFNNHVNHNTNNIKDAWNGTANWPNAKIQIPFSNANMVKSNGWNTEEANPFKFQIGVWSQSNGHQSSNPFL